MTTTLLHPTRPDDPPAEHLSRAELWRAVEFFAADTRLPELLDLSSPERQWERLAATPRLSVWVISWPPGTSTGWHDHGTARGAFTVLTGELTEHTWQDPGGVRERTLAAGNGRAFGRRHRHDVLNPGTGTAVSVHAYSPELTGMGRFELTATGPVPVVAERGDRW